MLGTEIVMLDGQEYEVHHSFENYWWYLLVDKDHWIHCTYDHRFYDHEGFPKQAQDFEIGDIIRHRHGDLQVAESGNQARESTKVDVFMRRIHLFWANGFLSQ